MSWTALPFSKEHKGRTLPQIVLMDPDWFFWAVEKGPFKDRYGVLGDEVDEILDKARRIKIPKAKPQKWRVEYAIQPVRGGLSGVEVVPASRPPHEGSTRTFRLGHFDLSVPYGISSYDKFGGRIMIRAIKFHVFGDSSYVLTRKRCEGHCQTKLS